MRNPHRISQARVAIALLVGLAAWFAPALRGADAAPDWLRAAAKEKTPDYPAETVAVVLLDEQQTTVKDNGQIETLYRRAFRVLRPEARERFSMMTTEFDSETKVAYMKAWTITAQGHELAINDNDAMERSEYDAEMYTDVRQKALKFLEVNPGNVIGYEYLQKQRPFMYEDRWEFQERVPVLTSRFILQLPAGWEISTRWINYGEEPEQSAGNNRHVWELKDIPAIETEPRMPAWDAVAGRMGVKYFPHDAALRPKTNDSWKAMGVWFNGLTGSSRNSNPAIKQKVTDLTAGLSDPVAKMRAITEYVQKQVRYFGIEIGIGGYQPHSAAEVFAHQYGDCKDKATLLSTMLREIGIDSYYVIIHTRRGIVRPDYPSMNFNHAILAIRLPDEMKASELLATVNHPTVGRLLFFDPTNEYVPLGYLPYYLQDSYGLVVTPDGGELLSLPLLPPASNRLVRTAKFELGVDGTLSGDVQEVRWGAPASDSRAELIEEQPAKRRETFENFLGNSLNNFTLTAATVGNLNNYAATLQLNYKFVAQGYARNAGDLLIVRPRVLGQPAWAILSGKPRKYPIQFPETTRQDDVFDITVPAGYVVDDLPSPTSVSCDYGTYKSEVKFSDGVLHYKRTYEITDLVVPTLKLGQVKDFLEEVAADENSAVALKRANP
jgi:transglutaminase-like putative cysteine protease